MSIKVETVLAAIAEVQKLGPSMLELINEIKTVIKSDDLAAISAAVDTSTRRADEQHKNAQEM